MLNEYWDDWVANNLSITDDGYILHFNKEEIENEKVWQKECCE